MNDDDFELLKEKSRRELLRCQLEHESSLLRCQLEHESSLRSAELGYNSIIQFALLTLKSLIAINGFAIITIIPFLGSLLTSNGDKIANFSSKNLTYPMINFISGLIFAIIATIFAYFAQHQFTHSEDKSQKISGESMQIVAILFALFSLVAFSFGAFKIGSCLNGL